MTIWIVRFISTHGGAPIDAHFKTEDAARAVLRTAIAATTVLPVPITDGFGIEIYINPNIYTVVITNTQASAAFQKALSEANHEAARQQGMEPVKIETGSTMQ